MPKSRKTQEQEHFAQVVVQGEGETRQVVVTPTENPTLGLGIIKNLDGHDLLAAFNDQYSVYTERLEGDKAYWTKVREWYQTRPWEICYDMLSRSPFLRRGLRIKSELAATGFKVWCKNAAQRTFCNKVAFALNLDAFETRHQYHLQIVDMALPWWQLFAPDEPRPRHFPTESEAKNCPKWLQFIHPKTAAPAGGSQRVKLRPWLDGKYARKIKRADGRVVDPPDDPLVAYLRTAAQARQEVLLDDLAEDFRVHYRPSYAWTKLDWEDWPHPSMLDVLPDVEYLILCAQIDAGTAAQTKAGFIRYGIGPTGDHIDREKNPAPVKKEVDELIAMVKENIQNRNPMYIGRNDLKIEWICPPAELFSLEKYRAAQARVMDFLDLPSVFWPVGYLGGEGPGESYASAYISVKPLRAHIESRRRTTRRWLERFLWDLCMDNGLGNDPVEIHYDNHVLLDDQQVQRNLSMEAQYGGISIHTLLDGLGYDPDYEIEMQKEEKELTADGIFVPRQAPQNVGGRPQTSDVTRPTDQPKPQGANEDLDSWLADEPELAEAIEDAVAETDI